MADVKAKKKKFVKIIAPKQFNEAVIGETAVVDQRSLIGRKIKINMMTLTDNPRNQNVQITCIIDKLKGDGVGTEIIGYTLLPAFVKRFVRKAKKKVDDCFDISTKEGKKVRIKPFLLTLNVTPKSVLRSLRKQVRELITSRAGKQSYSELFNEVVSHKLQNELRKKLSKIYPLKQCEIRVMELITKKGYDEEIKEAKEKKEDKANNKKEVKEDKADDKKEKKEDKTDDKKEVKESEEKEDKVDDKKEKKEDKTDDKKEVKESEEKEEKTEELKKE